MWKREQGWVASEYVDIRDKIYAQQMAKKKTIKKNQQVSQNACVYNFGTAPTPVMFKVMLNAW